MTTLYSRLLGILGAAGCLLIHPGLGRAELIYLANSGTNSVLTISPTGTVHTFAASGMNNPIDVVFDASGNVYVSNFVSNTIEKFSPSGQDLGAFAHTGPSSGPGGMAFDAHGNLYVSYFSANQVEKFTPGGQGSVFASGLSVPNGMIFDTQGNLYVSNTGSNTIVKIDPSGNPTLFAASGLHTPDGLAFDSHGNLFVANFGNGTIEKLSATGQDLGVFASTGFTSGPGGLLIDASDNVYVSDEFQNDVEKFNAQGQFLGVLASGLNGPAQMSFGPDLPSVPEPASLSLLSVGFLAPGGFAASSYGRRPAAMTPGK
jgi:sugar lactone lactonase YvrE